MKSVDFEIRQRVLNPICGEIMQKTTYSVDDEIYANIEGYLISVLDNIRLYIRDAVEDAAK
jgi:hypothetical protein